MRAAAEHHTFREATSRRSAVDRFEIHRSCRSLPNGCDRPAALTGQGIGVGNGCRRPLPPNPVCSSPATGSPVSCFRIGIGALIGGLRTS